ncbi:MAG: hypothetical protein ABI193_01980, partial [Minicystis sp.]
VGGASLPPPAIVAEPTMSAITALSSSGPSATPPLRARSKLVPLGVGVAVLLGVAAIVISLRPRAEDPSRVALAESTRIPAASAPSAMPSGAVSTIAVVPAAPPIEAPPASASASAPPARPPVVARPPPPPPPPPPGKRNPLDIQIK